ncbi:hypothetical protein F5J12DRAFT_952083 [Pisolithus orientalis]|uniref:uncharacterized protein n=1 Tax=Pisolithus orientalis TaxID=936130 RepID=UPI002224C642|nr:uncharacterized protein F5J12DRAFT_952083 [Pisolithus orientalis]KAI5999888.1 hypothetical protein F5J12DRAFT_952083 [Pisolithus orientalis]
MIAAHHLPEGFTFNHDPSHMWMTTATQLLSFWHKQQESHPNDVFQFQKWINHSGKLQPPVDRTLVPLQVVRQQKYQRHLPPNAKRILEGKMSRARVKCRKREWQMIVWMIAWTTAWMTVWMITARLRYLAGGKTMPRHHSLLIPAHIPHQLMVPIESNSHESNDEADEDTYLPTLSNSKKSATSLNTNPDLHSGNEYTTELQDHSEYADEDGLESIPFTDHPTEALSESSEPDMNQHQPGAKYSSKSNCNGSVTANATSTNVKQGVPGSTWKSPHVRKAPARPDADVPSPDAKRLCKQTGSNQKQK